MRNSRFQAENRMKQHTLIHPCSFEGKGLHTGKRAKMTLLPAPAGHGIVFHRIDLGPEAKVKADARMVASTARSTTLGRDGFTVSTVEHLMSALSAMAIDNLLIEIDNLEVPILDGSALPYVEAFLEAGIEEQQAERDYFTITEPFHLKDESTGSEIAILPADSFSTELTIDFDSKVLGVMKATFDSSTDYAKEVAPCRTFCFLHELEFLVANNLIKGGDMDNAIVIAERIPSPETIEKMKEFFGIKELQVTAGGYLDNVALHFDNECARHKLLDLIGDFALVGAPIRGKVIAYKSGHKINTTAARMLLEAVSNL